MNAILIPFFLAANVLVFDTDVLESAWKHGPEYTFNLTMSYAIKTDAHDPVTNMRLASTVKCRPKASDVLSCRLRNSTMLSYLSDRNLTREIETAQAFEIRFDERGVESLLMETPFPVAVVNIVRKIANQLSVGVALNERRIGMSQFIARENTSMGDCATMYRIERKEPELSGAEEVPNVLFAVLPMADPAFGATLLIEKSRMGCINRPQYVDFATGILKMGRFFSRIEVGDRFETFTEMEGKVRPPNEFYAFKMLSFKERIQLNLESIEPAQSELSPIFYGERIDLNINSDVPNNFID